MWSAVTGRRGPLVGRFLPCARRASACGFGSRSLEEVFVDLLEGVGLLSDHAAVVLDHESGQFGSVDEDQTSVHPLGIVTRIGAEPAGCDEDAAARLRAVQGTDEGLDIRSSYMAVGVPLGLHVDDVQPELVQSYEAVQASVTGSAEVLGGCLKAAVAHTNEELQHELLEELWGLLDDPGQQVRRDRGVSRVDNLGDRFTRREFFSMDATGRGCGLGWLAFAFSCSGAEFEILGKLGKDAHIDTPGMAAECLRSPCGDLGGSPTRPLQERRLRKMGDRPCHSVGAQRLRAAWEHHLAIVVGHADLGRDPSRNSATWWGWLSSWIARTGRIRDWKSGITEAPFRLGQRHNLRDLGGRDYHRLAKSTQPIQGRPG